MIDSSWLPWAGFAGVGAIVGHGALKFTWHCRSRLRGLPAAGQVSSGAPSVALLVACKAAPAHLRQALESLLVQDYPDYETVFTVASEADPAHPIACDLAQRYRRCRVVVAGYSDRSAEKTHNLVAAIEAAPLVDVYAFADSDIQVQRDWLRHLVAPLSNPSVGVTTAAKVPWLAADAGFWSAAFIRLFFSAQALAFGTSTLCMAWGGSMAMRRSVFERLHICERWARTVDDDISASRYVRDAHLKIHFVPLFVPTRVPTGLTQAFTWAVRQMQYLFLYYRRAWLMLMFLTVVPTLALGVLGVWFFDAHDLTAHEHAEFAVRFFVSLHMSIVGVMFHTVHRVATRCPESQGWGRFPVVQALLSPITVAVAAGAVVLAGWRKTMVWGGVTYRLDGPDDITVLSRSQDPGAVGPFEPAPPEDPLGTAVQPR